MSNWMSNWIHGERQLSPFKTSKQIETNIWFISTKLFDYMVWFDRGRNHLSHKKTCHFPFMWFDVKKKNIVAFDENKNNRKNIKGNFTQIFPPFKLRVFLSIILFYITFLAMQRYISRKIYHSNVTTTLKYHVISYKIQ